MTHPRSHESCFCGVGRRGSLARTVRCDGHPFLEMTTVNLRSSALVALLGPLACTVAACGDDGSQANGAAPSSGDAGVDSALDSAQDAPIQPDGTADVVAEDETSLPTGSTLTTVKIHNPTDASESDVPVTFGQVFKPGDVPSGRTVSARVGQTAIPLQVDAKARHADGSLRHAILTLSMSSVPAGQDVVVELVSAAEDSGDPAVPVAVEEVLATAFDASVTLTVGGTAYELSARPLLQGTTAMKWLSGRLVSEWVVWAPVAAAGAQHPHLAARFSVRAYAGVKRVRVAVAVENDWAFEPAPRNFVYDASIRVGAAETYAKAELNHYHHARWRKVFWWGEGAASEPAQDARYLMESGALPHYDPKLVIAESSLAELQSKWASLDTGPMEIGPLEKYMPTTGAHEDIGPLSRWDSMYLVSMDSRARAVTLGLADLAGSWSNHYRDKDTGLPVTLVDYPYMTLLGNPGDTVNPNTKKSEAFPPCAAGADCASPYTPDSSHQPSLGYLAYVVGGDYDHLEELQFWANVNMVEANPYYRGFEKGLLKSGQVRGQAWSLRTLGYAAYITPDDHPLKKYFNDRVADNLEYYVDRFTSTAPNALGVFTDGYAFAYQNGRGIAPWQDDFFTWSTGQLVAMGFDQALPLLQFKAKFPVGRMTDPGFCRIQAAAYSMNVRDDASSPVYESFAKVFEQSVDPAIAKLPCGGPEMAAALQLEEGEMTGYSDSPAGYPSNMQPAMAVAAESGIPNAKQAWDAFEQRTVKPDYAKYPNWAVTPRGVK